MKRFMGPIVVVIVLVAASVALGAFYIVDEGQQVVITQFGQPIGDVITTAGLHVKMPVAHQVNVFDKRLLEWDGKPNQIPTRDKKYIWLDTYARWRIVDPLKFLQTVRTEANAQGNLDKIINSAARDFISNQPLIDVVRSTNHVVEKLRAAPESVSAAKDAIERVTLGRVKLTEHILELAAQSTPQFGIELLDVQIKRVNYVTEVQREVYKRMISERKRAAELYRSEGRGKKAEIEGEQEKALKQIQSEAYRTAQELKGHADAEATRIYAEALKQGPEFYTFLRTLESYETTMDKNTTLILTTDSPYYQFLRQLQSE